MILRKRMEEEEEVQVPDPPIVGKVTHFSVELILDPNYLLKEQKSNNQVNTKYIVQEEELGGLITRGFGTVYGGFARRNVFTGLEPRTMYRYRVKHKHATNETPWSRPVQVTTTKKPPNAENLHKAVMKNDGTDVERLLKELKNDLIDAPDKYGYSPLMSAAFKGLTEMATVLLQHFADVSYQNSSGKNALMMACYSGHKDMVEILRNAGADWGVCDHSGCTPLHWAVDGGNVNLIRWMINDGCPVDAKDCSSEWTPLMRLSSMKGDAEIATVLISSGADVNALDKSKKSPLMMAALNGHTDLVKLLIANGARIDTTSVHDKTALDFARSMKHRSIAEFLEARQLRSEQKVELTPEELSASLIPPLKTPVVI